MNRSSGGCGEPKDVESPCPEALALRGGRSGAAPGRERRASTGRSAALVAIAHLALTAGCGAETPDDADGYPRACSDIYDPASLPEFALSFEPAEWQAMEDDCNRRVQQYRPATFRYGDEVHSVAVRLKGNWSWRCDKKQFVISFNEDDDKARFHGLRKLVLDAAWYDPTLLAERLGAAFMRALGVPGSCVNNARLVVNGEFYGVYSNVERLDKEYLQRNFPKAEADGNLYQGGDELKTNEEVGDVSRRDELFRMDQSLAVIEQMVDLDEALQVWAGLALLPDVDSYWAGVEINYYLYDHPTRGFLWLPYDMDMTAPTGEFDPGRSSVELGLVRRYVEADPFRYENPDWGKERLFRTVLSDARRCNEFTSHLASALQVYDVEVWTHALDDWAAQIAPSVIQDPHKPFSGEEHSQALRIMKSFLMERRRFVESWLQAARCPATW